MAESSEVNVSRMPLWFGLLGGAVAWSAHLMFAYVIAEFGCNGPLRERQYSGISLVAWLEITWTIATALVAVLATWVAYRSYGVRRSGDVRTNGALAAERHTAWAGLLTSALFTWIILFESIPILYYLHRC